MATEPTIEQPTTRYRGVVESTGEVVSIDAPAVRGRRRKGKRRIFALVDLAALDRLMLTGQEWTILHRLMRSVNPETNEAVITQAEIAEDLGFMPSRVGQVFKTLRERHIVFTLRNRVHRINYHLMFRGSTQDWEIVSASEREPLWRK